MPLVTVRRVHPDDATEMALLLTRNAAYLAPFEPARPQDWTTARGQRGHLETAERLTDQGLAYSGAIVVDGALVGRVNLANVVRGAFNSADLGYWVSEHVAGQGVGTTAVQHVLTVAFGVMRLHRVQAGTLVDNLASQKVLQRNGFEPIGLAHRYLRIAGAYRDHLLFQRLADA